MFSPRKGCRRTGEQESSKIVQHQSALSSAVEHFLHTEGVAGSNPAARTIFCSPNSWPLKHELINDADPGRARPRPILIRQDLHSLREIAVVLNPHAQSTIAGHLEDRARNPPVQQPFHQLCMLPKFRGRIQFSHASPTCIRLAAAFLPNASLPWPPVLAAGMV
jgi:hypothetical protein